MSQLWYCSWCCADIDTNDPIAHLQAHLSAGGYVKATVTPSVDGLFERGPGIMQQDPRTFIRADSACLCPNCAARYDRHPLDYNVLDYQGNPFLHVLCDGTRVKL